jgi:ADP-ribose pyrophosphatase YjhB (NUDIX family)
VRTPEGIILTKRDIPPHQGDWHLPGGTVQFGEKATDAVARVAAEELGIEVNIEKMLGYFEYPQMFSSGYKGWPIDLVFEVTIKSGTPSGSVQAHELDYFTEVPENIIPEQAEWLNAHYFTAPSTT